MTDLIPELKTPTAPAGTGRVRAGMAVSRVDGRAKVTGAPSTRPRSIRPTWPMAWSSAAPWRKAASSGSIPARRWPCRAWSRC
jgi:hypothetical protein